MVWLWILLLLIVVVVVVLLSDIQTNVYFSRRESNDTFWIQIRGLFGLVHFKYQVPVIRFRGLFGGVTIRSELTKGEPASLDSADKHHITKEKIARFYRSSKLLMENIVGFPVWVKDSLSRVRCTQLRWETRVGVGDAPETAMTTGLLWGVKSSLLGFLFSSMQIETKPKVLVEPQYNQMQFSTEFACIVKIRVGHAMVAGLLLLFRILRVKGGLRTWQSILFKA